MLDFKQFDRIAPDMILYAGEHMYFIVCDDDRLTVHVEDVDNDGELYVIGDYAASTLSAAIAIVERLEAGEAE